MSTPTVSWSETTPLGSENISLGDDRIRELKTQLREVISVDHEFANSGQTATTGQHKQVTLQEQANLGTGAVGATILGSQTVSGKGELVYTDEDNNDVQITSGGKLRAESLGGVYPVATLSVLATMMAKIYPVGSVYINVSDSTNPGTLLGIGTWVALGAGRMIVGFDSGDTNFDVIGEVGGANTVTLTTTELPAHTHDVATSNTTIGGTTNVRVGVTAQADTPQATSSTGSGAAFSVLNKYVTCYTWKRTA